VFGKQHKVVMPILVGVETDEDALLFHGDDTSVTINLADVRPDAYGTLADRFEKELFPSMKRAMIRDLMPMVKGNLQRIAEVRAMKRTPLQCSHMEQLICVGRGFDWLALPNKAIVIGPFSFDIHEAIIKAARIVLSNLTEGRIPLEDGVLVCVMGVYVDATGCT